MSCRAFTSDQYGPEMSADDVRKHMALSPRSAQMLVDSQRDFAARFGPASLALQDWLGLHANKLAFFVTRGAALRACAAQNLFSGMPSVTVDTVLNGASPLSQPLLLGGVCA